MSLRCGRLLTGQTTTGYTDAATSRELNPDETDYYEQNNFYVVELYANQLFNMSLFICIFGTDQFLSSGIEWL